MPLIRPVSIVALLAASLVPSAALAARTPGGSGASGTTGYDISYPQCGGGYPSGGLFGIVGVNGGLANDANGCLAGELNWALGTPGLTAPSQPAASLYVNTADPGPGVADWPTTGSSAAYGTCSGGWTTSCAYIYGEDRAAYSYGLAYRTNVMVAETAPWWLDIETGNSWATSTTPGYTALNVATIEGFIEGLRYPNQVPGAATSYAAGATGPVGVYSTASQWSQITGLTAKTSAGAFGAALPEWVAGARTRTQAQSNCAVNFTGTPATLAQYRAGGYDADLRCP